MKIRTKIRLSLFVAGIVGLGLAGAGAYTILKRNAIAESLQNARIITATASAIRSYTDKRIGPLLAQQMKLQFLPESIPFFAAKYNLQTIQKRLPNYTYREPTLNPTNITDRANGWETDLIDAFRKNPETREAVTIRDTENGPSVTLAQPLKIDSPACLACHSTPEKAPATMVALYGTQHGFGWKLGEIVGAQVVSIPLAVPLARAYRILLWFMLGLAAIFLIVIALVDLLVRAVVVKPIEGISDMADKVSLGQMEAPELVRDSKDEIGSLATSFNRMRRSLQNAIKLLEEQAD
jgi:HAMP domain-containing protein